MTTGSPDNILRRNNSQAKQLDASSTNRSVSMAVGAPLTQAFGADNHASLSTLNRDL